ncbi:hypothetical protein GJ699_24640 [Duganella sp. FT80W]|uniref:DUF2147 domain-containing protein n=1 Tax=Duganella guangzhouensis TaxID=2666084 RepID=A0A6I2L4F6_9BURK|nr:hypothetical protein [Duganella guangzhouensis]MRW93185.1 hypothetical protein [Duganella guangzhouensis]
MKILYLIALSLTLPAWAAPAENACANGLCGASGVSLKTLAAAAPEEKPAAGGLREELRRTEPQRDAWNRNLGVREDRENYNCALSFGVGGQLSKDGFVGSRVMGQTQTWRAPANSDSKP